MLASPETVEYIHRNSIQNEIHGHSLRMTRKLGHLANTLASQVLSEHQVLEQAKGEFESRVFEGLSTDAEFGNKLRVTEFGQMPIMGGKVMVPDEQGWVSQAEIFENGMKKAEEEAQEDPRKWTHFNRALNDAYTAHENEEMIAGNRDFNTRLVPSCDPADAIQKDGVKHWRGQGYVKGLCYFQLYHYSGGELRVGFLSFYAEDKSVIRDVFGKYGVEIPENTPADDYIKYALTTNFDTELEAEAFARDIREACDQSTGGSKSDTVDGLELNQDVMDAIFNEMHVPVAQSLDEKKKNATTHKIAKSLLDNSSHFDPEDRRGLIKICNSEVFDDDDARLMQNLIDYSAIEKLRSALRPADDQSDRLEWAKVTLPAHDHIGQERIFMEMSVMAATGAKENRDYSSCGGGISPAADKAMLEGVPESPQQEGYAGKVCNKEVKNGDSVKCPHCHKRVKAIVQNRGKIECSNGKCSKASASVKGKAD